MLFCLHESRCLLLEAPFAQGCHGSTNEETPLGDLQLKNDKTSVGINLPACKNSTYHKVECIVGNTGYQLVIYDHDLLLRFVKDYFGPFEMP